MNLFSAFAWLCILTGAAFGVWTAYRRGWAEPLWDILRGAGLGLAYYLLTMLLIFTVLALGLRYRPSFPRCRSGRCTDLEYRYLYLDSPATGDDARLQESTGGLLARCGCGTKYLISRRERRLWEVLPDGTLRPYMRYRPFGRWHPDPADDAR
jgi:hypothetical protein